MLVMFENSHLPLSYYELRGSIDINDYPIRYELMLSLNSHFLQILVVLQEYGQIAQPLESHGHKHEYITIKKNKKELI